MKKLKKILIDILFDYLAGYKLDRKLRNIVRFGIKFCFIVFFLSSTGQASFLGSLSGDVLVSAGRIASVADMIDTDSSMIYPVTALYLTDLTLSMIDTKNETRKYDKWTKVMRYSRHALIYGYTAYALTNSRHNQRIAIPYLGAAICYRF